MLASVNINASASPTLVYTSPSGGTRSAFSLSLCNSSGASVTVRVALTAAVTPSAGTYIEYELMIPANTTYERTGLVLKSTQTLYVQCSAANAVSAVVYGIEE